MFNTYFKSILRNFWKHKTYSFLNVFGLAIGIACAGLIFLWVEDEVNYDSVFLKKDRLYWIRENQTHQGVTRTFDDTPALLAEAIQKELPGIAHVCRVGWDSKFLFSRGDKRIYESGYSADSSFLTMFGFRFVQGRVQHAFSNVHSIVISQKMARQFFGDDPDVIGKTLKMDNAQEYVITGVIRDLPANSSLQFDWVTPFDNFVRGKDWLLKYWGANAVTTYVELAPDADPARINQQLYNYLGSKNKDDKSPARPFLFAMNDWRLRNQFVEGKQTGGAIEYVRLFTIIAWIILLIACINFMNLATARSEKRAREVGGRKVLGAPRGALIRQYIGEALLMSALSVFAGILLIELVLPFFNTLVEKQLTTALEKPLHIAALVLITLLCGLVAGSYPALYLSSFNPIFVFKGIRMKGGGAAVIRKGLVVFQFTTSIVLIISTIIIYQQVQHIRHRDLGYNKDHLIDMQITGMLGKKFSAIRQDLLNTGVVENAALASARSINTTNNTTGYSWEGKDPDRQILVSHRSVSPEYISTMGMHLIEGRDFLANPASDSDHILITRSLAKLMGKESAIGKIIRDGDDQYEVVGVIKDYVYGNMYGSPDPVIFFCKPDDTRYFYVRQKATVHPEEALAKIGAVMKKHNPAYPFDYTFVDDQFNERFKSELFVGKLSGVFASLAIVISCLGLFGLATYTAERRTKEIGIRKVTGAGVMNITVFLSGDFMKLVLISTLIAFPLAWWAMNQWLQDYAYRISIQGWVFVTAGTAAMLIALLTIGFQSVRAALANPVKSLRTE
jgi:putative ABC transport system permease protein